MLSVRLRMTIAGAFLMAGLAVGGYVLLGRESEVHPDVDSPFHVTLEEEWISVAPDDRGLMTLAEKYPSETAGLLEYYAQLANVGPGPELVVSTGKSVLVLTRRPDSSVELPSDLEDRARLAANQGIDAAVEPTTLNGVSAWSITQRTESGLLSREYWTRYDGNLYVVDVIGTEPDVQVLIDAVSIE